MQQALDAEVARRGEHVMRAAHIRLDEVRCIVDRAVDVRFGGEVHDRIAAVHRCGDFIAIDDAAADEGVARVVGDVANVVEISGVRQRVEVDDGNVGVLGEDVADEVAADESRAAGDQELSHQGRRARMVEGRAREHRPIALLRAREFPSGQSLSCGWRGVSRQQWRRCHRDRR